MAISTTISAYRKSRSQDNPKRNQGCCFPHVGDRSGFAMIYPLLWMLASSFKGPAEIWTNVSSLIPREFTIQNYFDGLARFCGITFTTFYKNSLIVTGFSTVAAVFSSALVAYGFARIRFVGRDSGLR